MAQHRPLTPVQSRVLEYIRDRYESTGVPPTYRDIQHHFGFKAVGTVQDHVKALIRKGHLERVESGARGTARSWIPRNLRPEGTKRLPVFGEIAAGSPREAEQLPLGTVTIAEDVARDPCFALRVTGDSMVEAGIFEGDYLIVERNAPVVSGDIVVALLNGETTVKRYLKKEGKVWLVPENSRMQPIPTEGAEFSIQGKVVALQRRL